MSATDPQPTSVATAVGAALAAAGVRVVFGVLGSGNLVATNALVDGGARFVAARHEGGAATMADGYARVSGEVGVVSVHQGPGLTNAMTGIAEAVKSRTPLLVLAADTPAAALTSNFRIDQGGMVAAVGAVAERVHGPAAAVADALRALGRAAAERRPVVLNLPLDVQAAPLPEPPPAPAGRSGVLGGHITPRTPLVGAGASGAALVGGSGSARAGARGAARAVAGAAARGAAPVAVPSADAVARAAALLAGAERPVVVAGRGAVLADAGPALQALAERAGALLATSAPANGLFAGDPFALGIAGGFASPLAQELLPQCDLVLAVGATLNHWTTRHGTLFGDAPVVQVDVDPAAGQEPHGPRALVLPGDARATAELLAAALPHAEPPAPRVAAPTPAAHAEPPGSAPPVHAAPSSSPAPAPPAGPATGWRTPETAALIASRRWRDEPAETAIAAEATAVARAARDAALATTGGGAALDPGPFADPAALTKRLDELLPADRVVAVDSGHFLGWPAMFLGVAEARAWVFPNGFQAVGLGLGCAIGAALARPERVTVAALGDGGCFMALPELETAARLRLKLLVVVYDDAAYGAEVHHFGPSGHAVAGAQFPAADLAALGRAAGAEAVTVRDAADLVAVERWLAAGADGPLVVDAKVDPTLCAAWLEDAFKGGG
ncbi:thiamine pyrophosphate-binding protein [Conexibacter arvalis]|uniref:Thiamine pyrophosphate-dependent acetolactate synthase large subunit-like protein n=1 Tax=Conexibacter arvalis TaxID=912552 RepID=A0A840ICZ2_9ACTN|nr:thiamine pyrophosphate-dependent acetolactate synthase large subunit-like protein [Conexibacter arvalis]